MKSNRIVIFIILLFILSTVVYSKPLDGIKICVDPGHGGTAPGSNSPTNPILLEKTENLLISKKLIPYLTEAGGATVIPTREDDITVSIPRRIQIVQQNQPDWFISIHLNAPENSNDHLTNYTRVYYYRDDCKKMASSMVWYQSINLGIPMSDSVGNFNTYDVLVFTAQTCQGNLSELAFITCTAEETLLKALDGDQREDKMAQAIYQGVVDYFSPPIVKKVFMKQGDDMKYTAQWQDSANSRTLFKSVNIPLKNDDTTVTVIFNEPVNTVSVSVKITENQTIALQGSLDSTNTQWSGTISQSQLQTLGDGTKTLVISAKDIGTNLLDGNPNTIAHWNPSIEHFENDEDENGAGNVGGKDQNHVFQIDTTPPVLTEMGCHFTVNI